MTPQETLRVFCTEHDADRQFRYCGLLSPDNIADYACAPLDDADLQAFDRLSELADEGIVTFRSKPYRIDDRIENGNTIRSVVEYFETDDLGNTLIRSSNHMTMPDGTNYFEIHNACITPEGVIVEPEVGSEAIEKGTYPDIILHALIANEDSSTTLHQVA